MKSFQPKSTGLFIGTAFLAVAACMAGSGDPSVKASSAQGSQATQPRKTVSQLYAENCASCHGQNGEGGGAGTRSILTRDRFDQTYDRPFFDAIKDGVPDTAMPAYKESLTDEQIWGLVVRLREFQGKALRAESGSPKP
jgi:mono/diheme cytochrome c family protein